MTPIRRKVYPIDSARQLPAIMDLIGRSSPASKIRPSEYERTTTASVRQCRYGYEEPRLPHDVSPRFVATEVSLQHQARRRNVRPIFTATSGQELSHLSLKYHRRSLSFTDRAWRQAWRPDGGRRAEYFNGNRLVLTLSTLIQRKWLMSKSITNGVVLAFRPVAEAIFSGFVYEGVTFRTANRNTLRRVKRLRPTTRTKKKHPPLFLSQ